MKYFSSVLYFILAANLCFAAAPADMTQTASPLDFDYSQRIDVNNIEMVVTNRGSIARNIADKSEYGTRQGKMAIFRN